MASAWGNSWGDSWGAAFGIVSAPSGGTVTLKFKGSFTGRDQEKQHKEELRRKRRQNQIMAVLINSA